MYEQTLYVWRSTKGETRLKRALILVNAYSKLISAINQPIRLKEEFDKLGVEVDIKKNSIDTAMIIEGEAVSFVEDYDFVIYLDKDKYTSSLLEKAGIRLFNRHEAIRVCDDKMDTHIRLAGHGISMPDTIGGLLCYNEEASIDEAMTRIELIEEKLGYPCIIKECYGSLGAKVYCADNREELLTRMEKVKLKSHLFQKMISSSRGRDVRVIVIGGKAICGMQRISKTDFRSNIELGGVAEPIELSKPFIEISEKVAHILDLDYCGIDILYGENGEPVVCEVNSNAFFGAMESVSGVNVAAKYAEYIYETIY
ncbi:MAG: RimK family alpha-L-glutamate ligase [Anaerolineaceae bacterium]|nr:MAG: RimK family alpha-L-glutamate ligase [Anaerolineaceae bacterium]